MLACPDDGITVLHDAVMNNHLNVVKLLTQTGGKYKNCDLIFRKVHCLKQLK